MTTHLTTRKGNKLQLNGNRISGDTYPIKDALKAYCGACNWDKASKSWQIDLDKLSHYMSIANSTGLRVDDNPQPAERKAYSGSDVCPLCHTYCDGDCTAH